MVVGFSHYIWLSKQLLP